MCTKEEVARYSRQLLVSEFGVAGQLSLLKSRVLVVGAGGLGCPVATYLAGAGVGAIGIVDFDEVSRDNLHRQVAHKESNIGKPKVESLKESILSLNSSITVKVFNCVMDSKSAMDIVKDFDVVADCSDNAATRYLMNDVCVLLKRPLVSGSALRWEGQLTVYNFGETCPCYRCLFPVPPQASLVTNCSEGGVLGPVVGTIGSMQAMEVIKVVSKVGKTLAGRLLLFDGLSAQTRIIKLRERSKDCLVCGESPTITAPIDYAVFCGSGVHDKVPSLSVLDEMERVDVNTYNTIRSKNDIPSILVDTRPPHEFNICYLPEAKNVPLDSMKKIDVDGLKKTLELDSPSSPKNVFVVCHRGNDSQLAVRLLKEKLTDEVTNGLLIRDIKGGYEEWAQRVDNQFPTY